MILGEGRLLKEALREAIKFRGRLQWVKDLRWRLEAFEWTLTECSEAHIEVNGAEESYGGVEGRR